mmetsp:Transcript_9431/g.23499  ORF Transcript_9431/g.23499 Transcript_9431/m.23499 type:complete len:97 (+) Transcript_9431:1633-1923(+)
MILVLNPVTTYQATPELRKISRTIKDDQEVQAKVIPALEEEGLLQEVLEVHSNSLDLVDMALLQANSLGMGQRPVDPLNLLDDSNRPHRINSHRNK